MKLPRKKNLNRGAALLVLLSLRMAMKKLEDTYASHPDGLDDARVLDWPERLAGCL